MPSTREEDYFLYTVIESEGSKIERVPCKVYLPRKLTDPVSLHFHPNKTQARALSRMFIFSIHGEIEHPNGALTIVHADEVYFEGMTGRHWGELTEYDLRGHPVDLKVTNIQARDDSPITNDIHGTFWITPNKALTPGQIIMTYPNGRVTVKTAWRTQFTLTNGIRLSFNNRFINWKNDDGEKVTASELVADYRLKGENDITKMGEETLDHLDDFLLLTSFAARKRCACLRWDVASPEGYHIEYYRRDVGVPSSSKDRNDLIDIAHSTKFLRTAYRRFNKIEPREYLRRAIYCAIPDEDRTLESSFATLYEGLESLVLYFRRRQKRQLEYVFPPDESGKGSKWKDRNQIIEDVKQFFSKHPLLKKNKVKRDLLFDNLLGLNRISFRTAFEKMCSHYGVDVSDLWPITGNAKGWSLSTIRNKIVHGEHFTPRQLHALMAAREHLQWMVERLIVAILGWDISKTKVSKDYLSKNMKVYKEREADQKILSDPRR